MTEGAPLLTLAGYVAAWLLVLAGIAGAVLPALPGLPLVFAGLLVAAWIDGFARVGAWTLAFLAVLTLLSFVVEYAAAAMGVKRAGASRWAVIGAALGTLFGAFFWVPGLLLGPFVGAAIGEYLFTRDSDQAGRAGLAAWIGFVVGTAGKLAIVLAMLGTFAAAWWFG